MDESFNLQVHDAGPRCNVGISTRLNCSMNCSMEYTLFNNTVYSDLNWKVSGTLTCKATCLAEPDPCRARGE